MANLPNSFQDAAAVVLRTPEVPDASWDTGMNNASCQPAIGVATDNPDLEESLPNWTLLDQDEEARAPQVSQSLGGTGFSPAANYPSSDGVEGKGTEPAQLWVNPVNVVGVPDNDAPSVVDGDATLLDLAVGWTSVPAP